MSTKNLRAIAIHLPQFHPFPENDNWWGKGFTEWSNVTKAKPLFKGHYQPQLPADLGFYDLRLQEARIAQAELAKAYGLSGFCYYHYWFNGKRLLNRPLDDMLETKTPDFPFMLCWANENWTRRWDGLDANILIAQQHSIEDDRDHIRFLCKNFFSDPRYIRVNSKPVISIYKSGLLPNPALTISTWREEAKKLGFELYICRFETVDQSGSQYESDGFDATIEFQPFSKTFEDFKEVRKRQYKKKIMLRLFLKTLSLFPNQFQGIKKLHNHSSTIDYNEYMAYVIENYNFPKGYTRYPCVMPSWDNTARKKNRSLVFVNNSPSAYKKWLSFHEKNFIPQSPDENFVFINAWNEWAEGNHLEPCRKWGRQYLEVTREVFENNSNH